MKEAKNKKDKFEKIYLKFLKEEKRRRLYKMIKEYTKQKNHYLN